MFVRDKHVLLQNSNNFRLIGTKLSNFCMFSIKKTQFHNYLDENLNIYEDIYETFLLVKGKNEIEPQKTLSFRHIEKQDYMILQQNVNEFNKNSTQQLFHCTFLRYLDLVYARKLNQVLSILGTKLQIPLENQWFMIYQIHNFKPLLKNTNFEIKYPVYGASVIIQTNQTHKIRNSQLLISNAFRQDGQNFFMLSDTLYGQNFHDLQFVISKEQTQIYGFTLKLKDNLVCIPFNLIFFDKSPQVQIYHPIMDKLYKTCYIQFTGSYCTGILISQSKVITTRHLLPIWYNKLNAQVFIRKFPYHNKQSGRVMKVGLGNLDLIQIQLIQENIKTQDKNLIQKKSKQYLVNNFKKQKNKDIVLFQSQKNLSNSVGDNVLIFGFGKFSYSPCIFSKFEVILPRIASGSIAKIIQIKSKIVFIKTDAILYPGFSGSGIWKQEVIGMAVFILKNKTTNNHFNRHNFSYSMEFIKQILKTEKKQIETQVNKQIQHFDRIQTRKEIKIDKRKQKQLKDRSKCKQLPKARL